MEQLLPAVGYRRDSANGYSREDGDCRFQLCHHLLKQDGVEDDSFKLKLIEYQKANSKKV